MRPIVCLLLAVCSTAAPQAREAALWRSLGEQFTRQHRPVSDADAERYLTSLSSLFARDLSVTLVDNAEPLVAALPPARIYMSTGAIARAHNESEIAGLLAHALAHLRAATRVEPAGTGEIPRILVSGSGGLCWRWERHGVVPLGAIERLRSREDEADLSSIRYLEAVNENPAPVFDYFDRLRPSLAPPRRPPPTPSASFRPGTGEFGRILEHIRTTYGFARPTPSLRQRFR